MSTTLNYYVLNAEIDLSKQYILTNPAGSLFPADGITVTGIIKQEIYISGVSLFRSTSNSLNNHTNQEYMVRLYFDPTSTDHKIEVTQATRRADTAAGFMFMGGVGNGWVFFPEPIAVPVGSQIVARLGASSGFSNESANLRIQYLASAPIKRAHNFENYKGLKASGALSTSEKV